MKNTLISYAVLSFSEGSIVVQFKIFLLVISTTQSTQQPQPNTGGTTTISSVLQVRP